MTKETDYGVAFIEGEGKCQCGRDLPQGDPCFWYKGIPYCSVDCQLLFMGQSEPMLLRGHGETA